MGGLCNSGSCGGGGASTHDVHGPLGDTTPSQEGEPQETTQDPSNGKSRGNLV